MFLVSNLEVGLLTVMASGVLLVTSLALRVVFLGFRKIQLKHMIENLPTSKARSCALGLVEVKGKVRARTLISSPDSGASCVYYWMRRREDRPGRNRKSYREASAGRAFLLEDDTGAVLVAPGFSHDLLKKDVNDFVKEVKEIFIQHGDELYVMGKAVPWDSSYVPYLRKMLDSGGEISLGQAIFEYEESLVKGQAVQSRQGREELIKQATALGKVCAMKRKPGHPAILDLEEKCDRMICFDDVHKLFVVSDSKEKKLCRSLGIRAVVYFTGGAVIAALSLAVSTVDTKLLIFTSCYSLVAMAAMIVYFYRTRGT